MSRPYMVRWDMKLYPNGLPVLVQNEIKKALRNHDLFIVLPPGVEIQWLPEGTPYLVVRAIDGGRLPE